MGLLDFISKGSSSQSDPNQQGTSSTPTQNSGSDVSYPLPTNNSVTTSQSISQFTYNPQSSVSAGPIVEEEVEDLTKYATTSKSEGIVENSNTTVPDLNDLIKEQNVSVQNTQQSPENNNLSNGAINQNSADFIPNPVQFNNLQQNSTQPIPQSLQQNNVDTVTSEVNNSAQNINLEPVIQDPVIPFTPIQSDSFQNIVPQNETPKLNESKENVVGEDTIIPFNPIYDESDQKPDNISPSSDLTFKNTESSLDLSTEPIGSSTTDLVSETQDPTDSETNNLSSNDAVDIESLEKENLDGEAKGENPFLKDYLNENFDNEPVNTLNSSPEEVNVQPVVQPVIEGPVNKIEFESVPENLNNESTPITKSSNLEEEVLEKDIDLPIIDSSGFIPDGMIQGGNPASKIEENQMVDSSNEKDSKNIVFENTPVVNIDESDLPEKRYDLEEEAFPSSTSMLTEPNINEIIQDKEERLISKVEVTPDHSVSMSTIGIVGTNSKTFKNVSDELIKLVEYAKESNSKILVDSSDGYTVELLDRNVEIDGALFRPYYGMYSENPQNENKLNNVYYFSNQPERLSYIISSSDFIVVPECNGSINMSQVAYLLSISSLYKESSKPIILLGKQWETKITQLQNVFGIPSEEIKSYNIAKNFDDLKSIISKLENSQKSGRRFYDFRDENDEEDYLRN